MYLNPSASSWKYVGPSVEPNVEQFHRSLPDYNTTPLVPLPDLANQLGLGNLLVKDESNRFGLPAFKILGASWAVCRAVMAECGLSIDCSLDELGLCAQEKKIRLVSCTEGNWGRAVARMAKYLGVACIILVPESMGQATQDRIAIEGADVVVVNGDYDMSISQARIEAEKEHSILVMDASWQGYEDIPQWVVEGYTTMLVETDHQLKELGIGPVTHAIASVGVGSWAQAVSMHYKSKDPSAHVISVEPSTAACLKSSLLAREMTSVKTGHTIMDGMNCGTLSYTAWRILRHGVDVSVDVTDLESHRDLQYLQSQGLNVGPCGAAPLSALRKLVQERVLGLSEESVVVLFSTEGAREYVSPS